MTYSDAENQEKDREMVRLVTNGVINPQPVFDLIGFIRVFGKNTEEQNDRYMAERNLLDEKADWDRKDFDLLISDPAYARRVEEQI